jgi:hypothetical protein
MRFNHAWDVVGEAGATRFVECDADGRPVDRRLYRAFRDAEARGELRYRGVEPFTPNIGGSGTGDQSPAPGYGRDVVEADAMSAVVLGGSMALYRDN